MSTANAQVRRRRPGFSSVTDAARLQLCAVTEDPQVQLRHIAALLAFTPTIRRFGNRMRIRLDHGPTALWLCETLSDKDVYLVDVASGGGTVEVFNPLIVLARYGFRDGRWVFGQGLAAAEGISRGAVHAAGVFSGYGLKVSCPSPSMMLTLHAVMSRLGIKVRPTVGEPRVAISVGDVPRALTRLGIADVAEEYQQLRDKRGARS
ncbi:MAG: hypothetical protein K0U84_20425 [Actinomycetia bacterium]|nr:hypothetical protein [Actinomycetes bacterium]